MSERLRLWFGMGRLQDSVTFDPDNETFAFLLLQTVNVSELTRKSTRKYI